MIRSYSFATAITAYFFDSTIFIKRLKFLFKISYSSLMGSFLGGGYGWDSWFEEAVVAPEFYSPGRGGLGPCYPAEFAPNPKLNLDFL